MAELEALAGPLLHSPTVGRLQDISFLGILSPRYKNVLPSPLWSEDHSVAADDGSRLDHTLGVTLLALDIGYDFGFSSQTLRYVGAWGLTHDIGTWPLSHTSEPSFAKITSCTSRQLRTAMLLGEAIVPKKYRMDRLLKQLDLAPETLLGLLDHTLSMRDEELACFEQVIHSPLTPDTLEGMGRCGQVFDVQIPEPRELRAAFFRQDNQPFIPREMVPIVTEFWNRKAEIYQRFINREDVVLWESACSTALEKAFHGLSLEESLDLPESELVRILHNVELSPVSQIVRYKEPQNYYIAGTSTDLPPLCPLSELSRMLRREPAGSLK